MKKLLNTLIVGAGALALVSIMAPTEAAAQSCRSDGYGYDRGHGYDRGYHAPVYRHRAPSRSIHVHVAPSRRVIHHPHYGGPRYYRDVRSCPPPVVEYRRYVVPRRAYCPPPPVRHCYDY